MEFGVYVYFQSVLAWHRVFGIFWGGLEGESTFILVLELYGCMSVYGSRFTTSAIYIGRSKLQMITVNTFPQSATSNST